jgi:hypothetical protein
MMHLNLLDTGGRLARLDAACERITENAGRPELRAAVVSMYREQGFSDCDHCGRLATFAWERTAAEIKRSWARTTGTRAWSGRRPPSRPWRDGARQEHRPLCVLAPDDALPVQTSVGRAYGGHIRRRAAVPRGGLRLFALRPRDVPGVRRQHRGSEPLRRLRTREHARGGCAVTNPKPDEHGRVNIGGRWWRCLFCGRAFAADCPCCEPPQCGCRSTR